MTRKNFINAGALISTPVRFQMRHDILLLDLMLGHLAVLSRARLLAGLNQVSSLGTNAQALNGLGLKSCPEYQVHDKEYVYLCISVRITWAGSLRLSGNFSATFLSPISTKASTSFSAVASFPSRSRQRTRTSIQHSLSQ